MNSQFWACRGWETLHEKRWTITILANAGCRPVLVPQQSSGGPEDAEWGLKCRENVCWERITRWARSRPKGDRCVPVGCGLRRNEGAARVRVSTGSGPVGARRRAGVSPVGPWEGRGMHTGAVPIGRHRCRFWVPTAMLVWARLLRRRCWFGRGRESSA